MKWFVAMTMVSLGAFVACGGGDDSNGGNPDADASTGDGASSDGSFGDGGAQDSGPTAPTANASDVDVYVTQTAQLDASSSTPSGATFQWLLASAPAGSTVSRASITNASTATPTLVPDVLGTYVLTLKVTAAGASATKNVNIRAFAGKALLAHTQAVDGGTTSDVQFAPTVGGDGGSTTISCETRYIQSFSTSSNTSTGNFGQYALAASIDWQEGAPASDGTVAFGFRELAGDGGFTNYLATGTTASRCDTLKKLDALVNTGDVPYGVRISPNGTRVAYIRQNGSTIEVATIGVDGSNPYVLGPLFRASDGGAGTTPTFSFEKRHVVWPDDTHVAWIADDTDAPGNFSVLTATDGPTPNVADYMDCTASLTSDTGQPTVDQFAMLPGGIVLVSGQITSPDAGPSGIVALRPNASTRHCEQVGGQIGVNADNFAISPDGTRIAYTGVDVDAGTNNVFVAPLDGGPATELRFNDAGIPFSYGYGPLWVQGGTSLLLSTVNRVIDGGSSTNASVIPAGGGQMTTITYSASAGDTYFVPTNDWSCTMSPAASAAAPAGGVFFAAGLFALRRRSKKKQKSTDS